MRKKIKLASQIVNLTERAIFLYDNSSGEIIEFVPDGVWPRPMDRSSWECPKIYYVVDPKKATEIDLSGRSLEDIAVVRRTGTGREGVMISFLSSVDDNSIVCYQRSRSFKV